MNSICILVVIDLDIRNNFMTDASVKYFSDYLSF